MVKKSAGILAYKGSDRKYEVFLVHPGGPFWAKKDLKSWSVPKGEFDDEEDAFKAAIREFKEETGYIISGDFVELGPVKQPGGKIIYSWAVEADFDAKKIASNTFIMEWPPKSGKSKEFPEVDKGEWFPLDLAREKILKGQLPILDKLMQKLEQWR
jgi:predicted NUDIX family NTP pyrophosphohydrolase